MISKKNMQNKTKYKKILPNITSGYITNFEYDETRIQ